MSILLNITDLLSGKIVEGPRMEFKQGWNPKSIMRSICAFANDFENEGSGYIIIGVDENEGKAIRPVLGFDRNNFEKIQQELFRYSNFMQPPYFPRISLEQIDEKDVLVIWCPAGANRPYKIPDDVVSKIKNYNFRIRQFSSSIIPNEDQTIELIHLTAKTPFDDRVNSFASVSDLSRTLMRDHLENTKSKLFEESENLSISELAEKMNLCQGANEHLFPKNVGLLMFSKEPQKYFKGAQIDLVEFPNGLGGKEFTEKIFTGCIQTQLINVLSYLKNNILKTKVKKYSTQEESDRVQNYPFDVLEEAISNAVYHKNYEIQEPIEIRILPSAIEIISFSGIDPSLKKIDFEKGTVRTRRYRNRRIGEFLKELRLTEGRGTGIPLINKSLSTNGSSPAIFDTNEPSRTHFIIEIPIHFLFEIDHVNRQKSVQVSAQVKSILTFCKTPKSRSEILDFLELSNHFSNYKKHINTLITDGYIEITQKENPKSRNQKYQLTQLGIDLIIEEND